MGDSQIAGVWTRLERKLHIYVLGLKALILALHHWAAALQGHHVLIATDNTTVIAYINKQGGTHSHLLVAAGFAKEVFKLAAAPMRPATNRMYFDRWLSFANWATGKGFDPFGPTAAEITAFLNFLILVACRCRLSKVAGPV